MPAPSSEHLGQAVQEAVLLGPLAFVLVLCGTNDLLQGAGPDQAQSPRNSPSSLRGFPEGPLKFSSESGAHDLSLETRWEGKGEQAWRASFRDGAGRGRAEEQVLAQLQQLHAAAGRAVFSPRVGVLTLPPLQKLQDVKSQHGVDLPSMAWLCMPTIASGMPCFTLLQSGGTAYNN